MRINRLAILCAAFGFASFLNFSAQAQITVDGTRDSGYGSALAVQTCGTSFGAGAGGSSLANAYAINDGTHLYLFIAGNLETNWNKLAIYLDTKTGGQNKLSNTGGADFGFLAKMNDLEFDAGFEADSLINIRWGGTDLYADLDTFGTSGVAPTPVTTAIAGGSVSGSGNAKTATVTLSGAALVIDNSATGGPTESDAGGSSGVTTGLEIKIPLSALGTPTGAIKVCALVSNVGGDFLSNQVLAGLPLGTANLGNIKSAWNMKNYSGNQFFTVEAPANLAPVISLQNSLVALVAGGTYSATVATATDDFDGDISANVTNNSATILDATARNTPGTYTVTYSVNDAARNTGTAAQKVVVYGAGTFASQYPSIAVPGAFNGWALDGSAGNALKKMANFTWQGIKYFTANNANGGFKFLAGGSWGGKEWAPLPRDGDGNSDLAANVTTNGWYLFAVTELNDTASVSRLEVNPTSDADSDGIPDVLEAYFGSFLATPLADLDPTADYNNNQKTALEDYEQGINPTQDTIAPTLAWAPAVAKLTQVAVDSGGGQYLGASSEVVASSEVPGEVPLVTVLHRLISGSNPGVFDGVDTSIAGLWQLEYTASDDFGNSSTLIRVVVVGDQVPVSPSGWFGLNYPASATISTLGSQSVYAQIYINNATPGAGQAPAIQCWIGVSSDNSDPSSWAEGAWTLATYNAGETGNNDEYSVPLSGAALGVGTHNYAARWQIGSGAYFYGGIDAGGNGNAWNATTHPSGVLTVNAAVARDVTFAVDMGVQAFRGAFTPGTDAVYLVGDVTNWTTGTAMVREGETNVYKLTLNLEGAENATLNYKFNSSNTAVGNGGFEGDMDAGIPGDTPRVLTLGAANVPQSLTTSTFNNQSEARKITVRVDMSIQQQAGNFNPSTGTVKVGGTFNGWTAASLVAQGNGIYAGEFLVDGPLSAVEYKFMNGDTYESISNRTITVALPNLAASTLEPVYFNNDDVAVADSTFAGAYPGKSMTDVAPNGLTYLASYAFGGDSNTQPILPVQDMSDPDKLRLIVVYRTDDPTLPLSGLRGEATTDLSGAWDLPDVSVADGDRTGLPDNLTRKVISVDRGSDLKKFLRATVTR